MGRGSGVAWGPYAPAIARWEHALGRPAPTPTEPGRNGQPRLSPRFVEWLMGLPTGHVTDPAIGISRNDQLKALGNGVVPQQAEAAVRMLLGGQPVGGAAVERLLPTPDVSSGQRSRESHLSGQRQVSLQDLPNLLLPTPRATDGTNGGPNQRGSSGDLMLPSAVHHLGGAA